MATRFGDVKLNASNYKQQHPEEWESYFEQAAAEVYAYSAKKWARLYARVFGDDLSENEITRERRKRQGGNEDDFGSGGRKYGPGGEGQFHKSLRLWISANPQKVRTSFAGARCETESSLDSGDRVDAVYYLADRIVVVEVKSRISNLIDLKRGVFQCIKYRAVKKAMDVRSDVRVDAFLVTEKKLPGEIAALLKKHKIQHFQAPLRRG